MARDKVAEALLDGLKALVVGPAEQRLYRSGKLEGLFPNRTGANGEAAALALREGYLEVVRTEERGKTSFDWVRLTARGIDHLAGSESPIRALEELRDALRVNHEAVVPWVHEMRQDLRRLGDLLETRARGWLEKLEGLSRRVDDALERIERTRRVLPEEVRARVVWAPEALTYLDHRQLAGASGCCTLPELYESLRRERDDLSVSDFHEGLRHLHEARALRLLPIEDAAALSRPEFALFDEGRVLYQVAV